MKFLKNYIFHILAFVIVSIWGATFVSTKILINRGLGPIDIMFYRFVMAYICVSAVYHKKIFADNLKDEFLLFIMGITGGSLYFLAENTALQYTFASNVALLTCTAPLLTALVIRMVYKNEPLTKNFIYGSFIALLGVALVILNGNYYLKINPIGDFLAISGALSWAFYSLILKSMSRKYSSFFITRKVMFYGIITISLTFFKHKLYTDTSILFSLPVILNFLFLGIIASMLCFIGWNLVIKNIGAVKATNYIYVSPFITLIISNLMIDEKITIIAITGAIMILSGIFLAEKKFKISSIKQLKVK